MSRLPPQAKRVFKGEIFEVYQWPQELYDGTTATFEMLKRPDTVVVIPVTETGEILYILEEQPNRSPKYSFPGGRLDEGEELHAAALRELREETGYEVGTCELFHTLDPEPKIDWRIHVFIAKGCKKVMNQNLDAGERIEVRSMSFEEMLVRVREPGFQAGFIQLWVLEALLDPHKMQELRQLILS